MAVDALALSQALIRCPSVTPANEGALDVLQKALGDIGFVCHRLPFSEDGAADVDNLYARFGTGAPNFCYAGHTDVVPVGDRDAWSVDPFAAEIKDGKLYGRGASDMKASVACFSAAAAQFIEARGADFGGSISLLITGDEEGPAVNGTKKMLGWLDENGEKLDVCLVGEPTNPSEMGEMVKIGRRGSLNGTLTVQGIQGHTAYPHLADNPIHRLVTMLAAITEGALDDGTDHFQATTLQVSTVDVGNPATNVIPGTATATFNIRYNDIHTSETLTKWLRDTFDAIGGDYMLDIHVSGEAFLTPPGQLSDILVGAVETVIGRTPELSTSGGTSDARFIKDHCPVAEFGLVGASMHKADEHIEVKDIETLTAVYLNVLNRYFPTE
ncbi:MAG: succinyl-diaminopimelate desuccinylase [Proteobacteria bacterium]|nr:succinyl-diaminopimelate desuccinylase [Pseudomonadota bacterium]